MPRKNRINTESSEMEFATLLDAVDKTAVGEEVSVGMPGLGNNGEGPDDAFQEDVEKKRNKESEVVTCTIGRRKRGRPSEKDKEGSSISKKAKKSPCKIKPLKTNNGKSNGFTKSYIKSTTEKCIFCHDEHLRDTFWEGMGQDSPKLMQIPICKRCHACFRDEML